MISRKYIIGVSAVATLLVGVSSLVLAENNMMGQEDMASKAMMGQHEGPEMVVQIGPNGKTTLRGTIKTVGSASFTVTSWGGDWTVNVPASANVMPTDITQFKVGDFVGVQGAINQGAPWTVDAKIVRDWTAKAVVQENKQMVKTERHNNQQEIKDVMKSESPKNWQGIATNINVAAKTFTFTVDGVAYTVTLVGEAKVVDKMFLSTDLAKVKEGDTVRVWGPITGTTINAYVFRDISLTPMTNTAPH